MLKKVMAVGLCVMILSVSSFALAEDVYVTKNGSKYHKETCRFIKNRDVETISKEAAIEEGLQPCSRCYKEDIASIENEGSKKKEVVKK